MVRRITAIAWFHVQLYRVDREGRTRPDGEEAVIEADDALEAGRLLAGEPLTETPAEGRYAARVWTVVEYAGVVTDLYRP